MKGRTCAACDCTLDANAIKVTIGGKTVEVCCDECAQKLKRRSPASRHQGGVVPENLVRLGAVELADRDR
jgi:hypothetical protein